MFVGHFIFLFSKCLFQSFDHLFIGWTIFLLMICRSPLCILNSSSLLFIKVGNIFFYFVTYFLTSLSVFWWTTFLILMWSKWSILYGCCFFYIKKFYHTIKSWKHPLKSFFKSISHLPGVYPEITFKLQS